MGSQVTLVQRGDRLMAREEPRVGELAQNALEADGIDVRLNSQVTGASATTAGGKVRGKRGDRRRHDLPGRRHRSWAPAAPRTAALGLDAVDVDPADGLNLDENCRLADGLWAIGDVTGQAMFTHVAKYQARVVADTILGKPRSAHYEGIPRVVFADPEIAAVGITTTKPTTPGSR